MTIQPNEKKIKQLLATEQAEKIDEKISAFLEAITVLTIQRMSILDIPGFEMNGASDQCPDTFPKDYALQIAIVTENNKGKPSVGIKLQCGATIPKDAKPKAWGVGDAPAWGA